MTPLAMTPQARKRGMLLVGHGTRDQQGLAEFHATARHIAEQLPDVAVEPCFLELAAPDIETGFRRLVERGAEEVVVSPLLLFAAGHAKQDIPDAVRAAAVNFPHISVRFATPLESHEKVLQASATRFASAIADLPPDAAARCVLLMVGRGSLDDSATAAMQEFTQKRRELTPVSQAITCFIAMAKPSFEDAVAMLAADSPAVVVVQPHLLFHGDLLQTIQRRVAVAANQLASTNWLTTHHLGPDPLVAAAAIERFQSPPPDAG